MRRLETGSVVTREWAGRLGAAALVGAIGFGATVLMDFDPQPVAYVVMVLLVFCVLWLVLDTVNTSPARWLPSLPASTDRVDESTSDLRVLTSHQQANHPSDVLRERLVALARGRDPGLADELDAELAPGRRIAPADIDRILTRIEETRDRD